jgi:23S rRNA G2069 N7-methylase RlmK/C1962 C5-methylase RlmI
LSTSAAARWLVDALVGPQVAEIAVLDLSEAALRTAQAQLTAASAVSWIAADVMTWVPDRRHDPRSLT